MLAVHLNPTATHVDQRNKNVCRPCPFQNPKSFAHSPARNRKQEREVAVRATVVTRRSEMMAPPLVSVLASERRSPVGEHAAVEPSHGGTLSRLLK
jgi:hypothetical protein